MLVLKIEDDQGRVSTIMLQDCLDIPGLPFPLLVPRHWIEQERDKTPRQVGTCTIFGSKCQLFWNQDKHCKTIRYNNATKMPTFFTAPGATTYRSFRNFFEANDASIPHQHVLQFDRRNIHTQHNQPTFNPAEFSIEEDLNLKKDNHLSSSEQHVKDKEQIMSQDLLHLDSEALC